MEEATWLVIPLHIVSSAYFSVMTHHQWFPQGKVPISIGLVYKYENYQNLAMNPMLDYTLLYDA